MSSDPLVEEYRLEDGELLLSRSGTIGRSFLYDSREHGECSFAGYLVGFKLRDSLLPKFAFYFTKCKQFHEWLSLSVISSTIGNVNAQKYANMPLPIPPHNEQRAIAAFLDRETARVDALVAKQERLIALLQEKCTALISHAVTKGLDPTVPMKDSGVPWWGEIPANWEIMQIRYMAESLQTGPFGSQLHSSDYSPGGIPVINPSHMQGGHIKPDMDVAVDQATWERLARHELHEGDIVFARRGKLGRCALVMQEAKGWLCGTGSLRMRPRVEMVYPPFLVRALSTRGVSDWLMLESVGSTMDNLNTQILSRVLLPIPSVEEQRAIADHLDRETAKIDALIARVQEMIERLQEYRTALISAAATGKIDVREA